MPDQPSLNPHAFPPDEVAILDAQVASGRYADRAAVVSAALRLLEAAAPADGSASVGGPVFDLAQLRGVHEAMQAAKAERDFVIDLTNEQRRIPHPEAILQLTAEAVGERLRADRTGFFRVVGDRLEFGAGWSGGRIRVLRGRMALAAMGEGYLALMRNGEAVRTRDCRAGPDRDAGTFARLNAAAALSVPLVRDMAWVGGLFVHHAEARCWTASETALLREVAELTWDAVERAEALRRLDADVARGEVLLDRITSELREEAAERLSAEDRVRQLQKMEAVGQLTGGIAHDFNNMLGVIVGSLELLRRRLARGDTEVGRYVDAALDGADRAATLTRRLLAFSRQQPLDPEALDVNRLIGGMAEILARTLGDAVLVEVVPGAGVWPVWADAGELENAVLNLAVNARDAMDGRGKLTIETANTHADAAYAGENDVAEGQYVVLTVTDTGTGMDPEVLARVFEPFYTTKPAGKGTGLGLSQVFGFAKQSNGTVKLYSEPGHGTAVKLFFPRFYGRADAPAARHAHKVAGPQPAGHLHEVVLVVEDEERVRAFAVDALRDLGYTVAHAANGEEALGILAAGRTVSLLFTDVVMPGITGRELADRAKADWPGLRVLYTTGFTRNAVVHNGVLDPGTNFLTNLSASTNSPAWSAKCSISRPDAAPSWPLFAHRVRRLRAAAPPRLPRPPVPPPPRAAAHPTAEVAECISASRPMKTPRTKRSGRSRYHFDSGEAARSSSWART